MNTQKLAQQLFAIGAIKFGEFKLKSGIMSPIYIDLRLIVSYPKLLQEIADAMWAKVQECKFDILCGVPYTALPIATAMSLAHHIPMVMRRKEAKEYGTKKIIEGVFTAGQTCLVVEDLITSGASILETIAPLTTDRLAVHDAVVLLDREQGGKKNLSAQGYNVHAVMTVSELLSALAEDNSISTEVVQQVKQFIAEHQI